MLSPLTFRPSHASRPNPRPINSYIESRYYINHRYSISNMQSHSPNYRQKSPPVDRKPNWNSGQWYQPNPPSIRCDVIPLEKRFFGRLACTLMGQVGPGPPCLIIYIFFKLISPFETTKREILRMRSTFHFLWQTEWNINATMKWAWIVKTYSTVLKSKE